MLMLILGASITAASTSTSRAAQPGAAVAAEPEARVEAHSADLLAVGLVHGDRMSIHLSRVMDNTPVHDAVVAVILRGAAYPAIAQVDGSYALTAKDLRLPGDAAVQFQVTQGLNHESLEGVLKLADAASSRDDRGNGRQMWWWALNFSVCLGFLWLLSRRKQRAQGGDRR